MESHDFMDSRLLESWRNRPEELRRAVQVSREAYQQPPKASSKLPKANYLVGESKGGTVLFGAVIASECSTAEFDATLKQAAHFIRVNQGGLQAARRAGKKTRQLIRLEVFLPPDFFPDTPPSVEGVPVEWFRWVPVNEQDVRVEKLARAAAAAGDSAIGRLLGHLKWLVDLAESAPCEMPPIGWAFRVYSAAVQLQFHASVIPDAQIELASKRGQKFLSGLQGLVSVGAKITKSLRTPKGLANAAQTTISKGDRDALVKAVEKILGQAEKADLGHDIAAVRQPEFEGTPDVAAMLRNARRSRESEQDFLEAAESALEHEPMFADLCRAVAGVVAARSPLVTGTVRPAVQAAAQEMATGFLGAAIENLPKRHKAAAKTAGALVKALSAAESPSTVIPS